MVVIGTAVPILLASDDDTEELESLMDSSKFWLVGMYNTLNPFVAKINVYNRVAFQS